MNFIYVMGEEARDKMLSSGYKLIKGNEATNVWVFEIGDQMKFALADEVPHIMSNMLTF